MENAYKTVQLKDKDDNSIMPLTLLTNILTPTGDNVENILLNVENKIDNIKQVKYSAGPGIIIDENNVISCAFLDGTEVKY